MDDADITLWAVPLDDPPTPPAEAPAADEPGVLPFEQPARPQTLAADGFLLRGYDSPGEFFQPRLRRPGAA